MIDELELLRRHIDATVDSDPNLEPVRRRLVTAIDEEGSAFLLAALYAVGSLLLGLVAVWGGSLLAEVLG